MPTTEERVLSIKEEATKVLAEMQLDLTTACDLFLDQVVKQDQLPFEITVVQSGSYDKI